jgi:hypothetical protein
LFVIPTEAERSGGICGSSAIIYDVVYNMIPRTAELQWRGVKVLNRHLSLESADLRVVSAGLGKSIERAAGVVLLIGNHPQVPD